MFRLLSYCYREQWGSGFVGNRRFRPFYVQGKGGRMDAGRNLGFSDTIRTHTHTGGYQAGCRACAVAQGGAREVEAESIQRKAERREIEGECWKEQAGVRLARALVLVGAVLIEKHGPGRPSRFRVPDGRSTELARSLRESYRTDGNRQEIHLPRKTLVQKGDGD